jgi:hypothetical protein
MKYSKPSTDINTIMDQAAQIIGNIQLKKILVPTSMIRG